MGYGPMRVGKVGNVIAAPKGEDSCITHNIAMNVIAGGMRFNRFKCAQGDVLVIDNELHRETISYRLKVTADAYGVPRDIAGRHFHFICPRELSLDLLNPV